MLRFEHPFQKGYVISKLIIFRGLLNPKITNKNIYTLPKYIIDRISAYIWNMSIEKITKNSSFDIQLNKYLAYEETKLFSSKELLNEFLFSETSLVLDSPLEKDLHKAYIEGTPISLDQTISALTCNNYTLDFYNDKMLNSLSEMDKLYINMKLSFPFNLNGLIDLYKSSQEKVILNYEPFKRLAILEKYLADDKNSPNLLESAFEFCQNIRSNLKLPFPPRLVLIVEGITEEILLPSFANTLSCDFNTNGIFIIGAGGKNQVSKLYNKYKHIIKLPIVVLLDSDANNIAIDLDKQKRTLDKVVLIDDGEFEDILSLDLICKSMNNEFMLSPNICYSEINKCNAVVPQLIDLWKSKGIGEFSKSNFATIINKNIESENDCSEYLKKLIKTITSYTL